MKENVSVDLIRPKNESRMVIAGKTSMAEKMRWRKDPIAFPDRRMKKLQEDVKEMHCLLTFIIELLTFIYLVIQYIVEKKNCSEWLSAVHYRWCRPVSL